MPTIACNGPQTSAAADASRYVEITTMPDAEKSHWLSNLFVIPIAVGRILAIVAFILPRIFKAKVRGEIYNHLLTMYYVSATKQRPSCGSLTLRLGDGRTLTGHQIYHDVANHELNTAPYELRQK